MSIWRRMNHLIVPAINFGLFCRHGHLMLSDAAIDHIKTYRHWGDKVISKFPDETDAHQQDQPFRILIIDDEESILLVLKNALEREGYQIDTADNGDDGLDRLSEADYDLILCDMQMPGVDGADFFHLLKSRYPSTNYRILFMTGDITAPRSQQFLEDTQADLIRKPFDLSVLYQKVRAVLDEPSQ